jgi:cytochrome c553
MKLILALLSMFLLQSTAQADAEAGKQKAEVCAACHGLDGNSIAPNFPNLAGQTARYIYLQLKDFQKGKRNDPMMSPMAANLTKQDMFDLADWYASQKFNGQNSKKTDANLSNGKKLADAALCTMCHLGGFSGQNEVPRVAGQHYEYIIKQLKDFKYKNRTNDFGNMSAVVKTIEDKDLEDIAAYVSTLH